MYVCFPSQANRKWRLVQLTGLRCSSIDWGRTLLSSHINTQSKVRYTQTHKLSIWFPFLSTLLILSLLSQSLSLFLQLPLHFPSRLLSVHHTHMAYSLPFLLIFLILLNVPSDWKERVWRVKKITVNKGRVLGKIWMKSRCEGLDHLSYKPGEIT